MAKGTDMPSSQPPGGIHKWPEPGTVVWIPVFLIYRHRGIVSDRWWGEKPMVISNSRRRDGVFEEPWDEFRDGVPVYLEDNGHPGTLPGHEILRRARSVVGTTYDLFTWNCDDLVAYSHGVKSLATQLGVTVAIAVIGCVLLGMRK